MKNYRTNPEWPHLVHYETIGNLPEEFRNPTGNSRPRMRWWLPSAMLSMDAMQAVLACLRPAVVALIASAALTILRVVVFAGGVISVSTVQVLYVALFIIALAVLKIRHSNPILVMVCCGAVSLAAKLILG